MFIEEIEKIIPNKWGIHIVEIHEDRYYAWGTKHSLYLFSVFGEKHPKFSMGLRPPVTWLKEKKETSSLWFEYNPMW